MNKNTLNKIIQIGSNPKIFICTLFWMMVLVVIGTLAQRDYGLYDAQQRYFSGWIAWIGFIPTPGGRAALSAMTINIMFFMLKPGFWSIKKIGIITIHLGVLLLLIGGGLTAWFSSEGNMVIKEGDYSNYIVDLFAKELTIINQNFPDREEVISISDNILYDGNHIKHPSLGFDVNVIDYFTNCTLIRRVNPVGAEYKGLAQNFWLKEIKNDKEFERNMTGMTFEIKNANEETDGIYSLFLAQAIPQTISVNDSELILELRRKRTYLPFKIELKDFKKVLHAGTNVAKRYSSDVILVEDEVSRSVLIQMNEPLRYKDYTFYQSSFNEGPDGDTSILAVVKNYGRLFPYISSLTISLGLLLHMFVRFPLLFRKKKRA